MKALYDLKERFDTDVTIDKKEELSSLMEQKTT